MDHDPVPLRARRAIRRMRYARRLGVWFLLRRFFRLPGQIKLQGRTIPLLLPEGAESLFVDIVLDDEYGLGRLSGEPIHRIVDIGANCGVFLIAARARWPNASIAVYEPNPAMQRFLSHQCQVLDATWFAEAVGPAAGSVHLEVAGELGISSNVVAEGDGPEARMVTLATVVERMGGTIDLLKLDIEGMEWEILTPDFPTANVHWLCLEFHGRPLVEATKTLRQIGYRVTWSRITPIAQTLLAVRE